MAMDGLSEVIGSWNTMPMRAPRRSRNSLGESLVTSLPSNWIAPAVRWMAGGSSPMIARAASVLPEPDSPTMPTISPGATEKLTVLTTSSLVARNLELQAFDAQEFGCGHVRLRACVDRACRAPHRQAG